MIVRNHLEKRKLEVANVIKIHDKKFYNIF